MEYKIGMSYEILIVSVSIMKFVRMFNIDFFLTINNSYYFIQ